MRSTPDTLRRLTQAAMFVPSWIRGVRLRAKARVPASWVSAEAYDPGFDEGDSAYHAVHAARDGRIYFTVSTHRPDTDARVGCFDPATRRILFVESAGAAVPREPRHLAQGKIHALPGELDGRLYLATHLGWYRGGSDDGPTYPGFHILELDLRSGRLTALAQGPAEEGWIAGVLDPHRGVYYGLTFPLGRFCRYDIAARTLRLGDPPCRERPTAERSRGQRVFPVCRSLGIDQESIVYGACRDGSIWRCLPGTWPQPVPGVNVNQGITPPVSRHGRSNDAWRAILWDREDQCFYGTHAGTQSLFRYVPPSNRIEPLGRLGVRAFARSGHAPLGSQLGLVLAPDRTLYHIAHGPPARVPGRPTPGTTAYLVSFDLRRRRFMEHGAIRTDQGERVLFAESLTVDATGTLYTMAWVEVAEATARARFAALRSESANGECRGEVYRMMLIRIPPDRLHETRE